MNGRNKLGILFLHHSVNRVVKNNLSTVQSHNPDASIVTLTGGRALPGGYSLAATPEIEDLHALNPSRGSDWLVISWFLQRKEKCDRWWIIEWDTFCRTSVEAYYRPVWKFPFIASSVMLSYREPGWHWFRYCGNLPDELRPYALGGVPFLYLISEDALRATCQTLLENPCSAGNGELRFCTAANRSGFTPCGFSPPNDRITHIPWLQVDETETIFHPVKDFIRSSHIGRRGGVKQKVR